MNIGRKLKDIRLKNDLSIGELADLLNKKYDLSISKSMISRWENNKSEPINSFLAVYAKEFGADMNYLIGVVREDSPTYQIGRIKNSIPLIGQIAAGSPILAEENIEDYFEIDRSIKADFCLKIKGDSMIDAGIFDGDIAFIRKQKMVENGQIAAVVIGEQATLKRFYKKDSSVILQPENKDYEPLIFTDGEMYIAGKLVAVLNLVK